MTWTPKPPKQSETDGKVVKKQLINRLLKKELDKPTKTVYNIRKDAREVQDLWRKFIYSKDRVELNNDKGYQDQIRNMVALRAMFVNELCHSNNLPMPVLAGGALRDLIWNCMPKDYDFFFNCQTEEEAYELMDRLTLAMNKHGDYTTGGEGENYDNHDDNFDGVYGVFNTGASCQLIVGVWPECKNHIYERFDLSVCEAEMDLETFDITVSEDFLWSISEKNIKNKRPESKCSQQRMNKQMFNLQLGGARKTSLSTSIWRAQYFVNLVQAEQQQLRPADQYQRFDVPLRPEQ